MSEKFIGKSKKEDVIKKISKSNKENGNNNAIVLYWSKRGFTKEAIKLISNRQSTFSLKKCINKYGPIDGFGVWYNRQIKWQNTLKSKSLEEINTINRKKGTGLLNKLFKSDPEVKKTPSILYYIRFYNEDIEFWKVGITSKTIDKRFSRYKYLNKEIIYKKSGTFYECYKGKQIILKENNKFRINVKYKEFKSTEAFNKDIYAVI